ncbi:transcriptional regulator, TetR family [Prauserella flava]|uniref:AcrR family transcriptional regulator n=2 Tax=Prauserella salsuginis group TaxID=2893672 RepID=A0A839XIA8_9PSEU|nr:AcrR family transcriptional regulator [Prauserella sediminis]MCR3719217.1 transcriptional regulator, TetR family [Prauserella flava]MCR3735770.1 transcriptional regulator, TetR family [Prauserella salsuginis]
MSSTAKAPDTTEAATGPGQGKPRKRMPRAQRERQMIQVAEAVFAERGYTAASMDEIAERVGVSKPMLYEYFHSKEGLLVACIREARAELRRVTEQAVANSPTGEEALRQGLRAFFGFIRDRKQAWLLVRHEASLVGTASEELETTRQQQTDLIATLMGDFTDPETARFAEESGLLQAAAEFVVGGCERLAIWSEQRDDLTPEIVAEYAVNLLWGGLAQIAGR